MKAKFQLLVLFCIIAAIARAQEEKAPLFTLGDPAPPLRVGQWIKGTPINNFEKGSIYVVEFCATWCAPCNAAMPHLSATARKYKDKVAILAVDIYEKKTTSIAQVKAFVDNKGDLMDFSVAVEDTSHTVNDWLDASDEKVNGIPRTFIINTEGKVAWIGQPKDLDNILPKILNNTWDIKEALAKQKADKYLAGLDAGTAYKLARYDGDYYKMEDMGHPDSALLVINKFVKEEPRLQYAPTVALFTFPALLKKDQHKAYEYGKKVIVTSTYDEPAYDGIIANIDEYNLKLNLTAEIFRLGADAYQEKIDHATYPDLLDMPKLYHRMAVWYWQGGDKSKAIKAEQKAKELVAINSKQTVIMPSELVLLKLAKE